MTDRPTGPFWDASHNTKPKKGKDKDTSELNPIRDKDNADKRIRPPSFAPHGEINRAPAGMSGMRRNLPVPDKAKVDKGFKIDGPGELKREFKPLVRGLPDKDHGRDR